MFNKITPQLKIFICIILVFATISLKSLKHSSATYDEAFYITYGYSLWKTHDFRMAIDKPPFTSLAIAFPLNFINPDFDKTDPNWDKCAGWESAKNPVTWIEHRWNFALDFFYRNKIPADTLLFWARFMILLFSTLFGILVFIITTRLVNINTALIATILYFFNTEITAHSLLATEDLMITGWFTISTLLFLLLLKTPSIPVSIFTGITLSLAITSKFTGLFLVPIWALILVTTILFNPKQKLSVSNLFILIISAVITLLLVYSFVNIKYFLLAIKNMMTLQTVGQECFLAGNFSDNGFRYYYLYIFFIKTALPLLVLIILGIVFTKDLRFVITILIPVVTLFLLGSITTKQLGLRYILPIYPFLFLIASGTADKILSVDKFKFTIIKVLGISLIVWYLFIWLRAYPHYLSYFNDIAGGSKNGWNLTVDSNCDWGQDLHNLKKYLSENKISDVILSYYGACRPEYAGFKFQDVYSFSVWGDKSYTNPVNTQKEVFAISVTNLQGVYFNKLGYTTFWWLKPKKELAFIGNTIKVYDITTDVDAHQKFAVLYFLQDDIEKTSREIDRLYVIDPNNKVAKIIETCINLDQYKDKNVLTKIYHILNTADNDVYSTLPFFNKSISKILSHRLLNLIYYYLELNNYDIVNKLSGWIKQLDESNVYSYIYPAIVADRQKNYMLSLDLLKKAEKYDTVELQHM